MKQTAIQELISEFQELKKTKLYEKSFKAIDDCINLAYAKLEMEKQQIIEAWIAEDNPLQRLKAEQYYNETYKN
jgi:hypothetical protein